MVLNPRNTGTVLAFELSSGQHDYISRIGGIIRRQAMQEGIYLRPLGNTIYIMPPYCISAEQLEKVYRFLLSLPALIRSL
jgi:adenosylmethionine-8-amino-7-oxononanoate aminotransferase